MVAARFGVPALLRRAAPATRTVVRSRRCSRGSPPAGDCGLRGHRDGRAGIAMTLSAEKRTERSVDSLQKVYAFVISLALVQAIQIVLVDRTTMDFVDIHTMLQRAPAFVALLLVLVPFYHGMNRHLDVCYIENTEGQRAEAAL